ncbi:MAG: hypothetical protein A2Z29_00565 [Chloroflexi bacterium RBG_16_56_11]|nr:MAG: hypothetical protein A2Z29_00565 [Chloroflexi bacterium RBG_16_56_11]
MRQLSATLLAAQKQATSTPYVRVEAIKKVGGVVRLDWARLYEGTEDDYYHAATMPGDGSLVRARITPPADSRKLYRQRTADPGPGSDFSQWVNTGEYNAVVVAAASLGAEVSIFWIKTNREIRRIKSTDYGVSWGGPELIDYAPSSAIYGLAAAYKPGGDLAIFFADQSTLYVKKHSGGQWQAKAAWDKATGNLSGVAAIYDGDWDLIVSGKDSAGNFKLWGLVYGDGGSVPAGNWSALKELASAPMNGAFEYRQPFLDKPDVLRCFFVEKFTGTQAYSRPFWTHTIPGTTFIEGLWRESVPFNLSAEYGLAPAHHGDTAWLCGPDGVWTATLAAPGLDLTADVVSARQEIGEDSGRLTVELRNDNGQYASPGQGDLGALDIGCQIEFSPGYVTAEGNEYSPGHAYRLEACEHTSSGGRATLVLHARDGWHGLGAWRARQQLRWNKAAPDTCVRDIIAHILARAGLKLEVITQSATATGFYPDFTVSPGNDGAAAIGKLLSFVPDVIFIEGEKAYMVNPQSTDNAIYSYGDDHPVMEGRYVRGAQAANRAQVEGADAGGGIIMAESFTWGEIDRVYDRLRQIADRNITTVAGAQERGQAILRQMEISAAAGEILAPVNCGQQLYDVIALTDPRAGLDAVKKRALGMLLVYQPGRGEYSLRLRLGAV